MANIEASPVMEGRGLLRTIVTLLAGLVFTLAAAGQVPAQPPARLTLVKAGRMLDPRTGSVLAPAAVLVENDRIKEVGAPSRVEAAAPAGVKIIDLGSATLLPGLIDCHTHLLLDVIVPPEAEISRRYNGEFVPGLLLAIVESPAKRVLLGAQMAREDLESGFTTVRNLGHSGIDGDAALRDAVNAGRVPGPRILASGRKLAQMGKDGYVQSLNPALARSILEQEFLEVTGTDGAKQAVKENSFYNVDLIKVAIEDDISVAEMKAIVEEAHRGGLRVAVHAITPGSIQTAIDGGANSIEHGNNVTDAQLKMMRDKGMFIDLTPTFYGGRHTKILGEEIVMSPEFRSARVRSDELRTMRYDSLVQRVVKSGVKFAAGSDMCWFTPGKTRGQASADVFTALRDAGMPPLDIVRSVTTSAADMLGWQESVGVLEPGKYADLVAVAGDPISDIKELERVRFVMKGGQVVRNDLTSH